MTDPVPIPPGGYVEEIPGAAHPIAGVATSITAFVGYAKRGPVNEPTTVRSFAEFGRAFGGLWGHSTMSRAVQQYFMNGGTEAIVVRAAHLSGAGTAARKAQVAIGGTGSKTLTLEGADEGAWADALRVRIDHDTKDKDEATPVLFNLLLKDVSTGAVEVLRDLPPDASLGALIEQQSTLVRATGMLPTARPDGHALINPGEDPFDPAVSARFTAFPGGGAADSGLDGDQVEDDLVPAADDDTGIYALGRADLFNLLCIPPFLPPSDPGAGRVLTAPKKALAAKFCLDHRALFIIDGHPDWTAPSQITAGPTKVETYLTGISSDARRNCALYFPYVRAPDPLQNGAVVDFPPCGAIAGVVARTDTARGVWKAPAGSGAGLAGLQELKAKLTSRESAILTPLGVNCLRTVPGAGTVVWGARTLAEADVLSSEWKYIPVRRLALFVEESLCRGTKWVIFEPGDEPLWAQIRLDVGAFLDDLFRRGAFQGTASRDAYFVKCGRETMTQADIDNGVVNILVGFAPIKPAEFVILKIQQLAGQTET